MLVIKSKRVYTPVEYYVSWRGDGWRDVPKPVQAVPEPERKDDSQRRETPEGLCAVFEPPDQPQRCFANGCKSHSYYRVYLVTGNPVAGRYCWSCSRRVLVRERRSFLQRRARKTGVRRNGYRRRRADFSGLFDEAVGS